MAKDVKAAMAKMAEVAERRSAIEDAIKSASSESTSDYRRTFTPVQIASIERERDAMRARLNAD